MMEREMSTFANPTSDFAFKLIFSNENNKHILLDFLNTFLSDGEESVSDVEIISPFLEKENEDYKLGIVDLLCTDKSGCKYVVEMQNAKIMAFDKRIEFYVAKAKTLEENKENLKKAVVFVIATFKMFPESEPLRFNTQKL
jgi:predicted transposase/invertase (TIGR01784 family)